MIQTDGFRELTPDERVCFTYEVPGQDGYAHRAVAVTAGPHQEEQDEPSAHGGDDAGWTSSVRTDWDG